MRGGTRRPDSAFAAEAAEILARVSRRRRRRRRVKALVGLRDPVLDFPTGLQPVSRTS